jgi:hypothetical protein
MVAKIYCTRPMLGYQNPQDWKDELFEKRVREYYVGTFEFINVLANENFDHPTSIPNLIRVCLLEEVPEASAIMRSAEDLAYDFYDGKIIEMQKQMRENNDFLASNENDDDSASFRTGNEKLKKLEVEYRRLGRVYCYNLKFFYPMFAMHHVDPATRNDGNLGRFYCPCGRAAYLWRKERLGLDEEYPGCYQDNCDVQGNYIDLQPDDCGMEGDDSYQEMTDLVEHLAGRPGPMHQAAKMFILSVYFMEKKSIGVGSIIHDVDAGVAIKVENRSESDDAKPAARTLPTAACTGHNEPDPETDTRTQSSATVPAFASVETGTNYNEPDPETDTRTQSSATVPAFASVETGTNRTPPDKRKRNANEDV